MEEQNELLELLERAKEEEADFYIMQEKENPYEDYVNDEV